jgi:hypothetical protein
VGAGDRPHRLSERGLQHHATCPWHPL